MLQSAPLTVYKASAGSGKTFTLAAEYIKLLVSDPQNYRYTLAVTFTNKATQEMKQRILSTLYGIANSLPDADDYYNKVKEAFPQFSERVVRMRAGDALAMLIHDYNYFRVETIDSFFQRILRNLARELGLTANLQVMLNDYEVESQAVDNIVENIDSENDPLLSWIMDFVQERMDDDKSWNVIGQIKDFGRNIFSDFYKDHQAEFRAIMDDAEFFNKYTSTLRDLKAKADKQMKTFAERYDSIATHAGITDSCYTHGKSNAPGYFANLASGNYTGETVKIPNSYVLNGLADPAKFVKKADINKPETQVIINDIAPLLEKAEQARKRAAVTAVSVNLTLQNVNQLRLLGRIEKEVNDINAANNDYPLSNTQKLLNNLIDGSDSPFIYEKIGGMLRYIMIDEFQDTSTVQWDNFKVLLDDCIAHQAGSLIVGDVKQSIYRWRNGDWRLLQSLTAENSSGQVQVKNLDTNYRSQRNIVEFNNAFFKRASEITAEETFADLQEKNLPDRILHEAIEIKNAYADVAQNVPSGKPKAGLVEITMLPKSDYDDLMIQKVKETIETLLENGIPQNKIAVIVRKNKHIKLLAAYFLHNPVAVNGENKMVNMVSDEAFRLDASLAVSVIVKAMHLLAHPDDNLAKAFLAKAYTSIRLQANAALAPAGNGTPDAETFLNEKGLDASMPRGFLAGSPPLLSMPLVDLAEKLFRIFHLEQLQDQSAYVCAFFDQLSNYLQRHIAGIDEFLEKWDEELCAKSIHSDETDGIRLLTVHKSKGLEYDNVIMPYCDWKIEDRRDILWVEPKYAPFNRLPVVPVNVQAKKLQASIYADDYESEHIKNLVDNLNILYVAFTRASKNLFVISKKDSGDYPSEIIQKSLDDLGVSKDAAADIVTYRYGTLAGAALADNTSASRPDAPHGKTAAPEQQEGHGGSHGNVFMEHETGVTVAITNTEPKAHFRQSNASTDFMTPDDEMEEKQKTRSYIDTGNILHKLFASIHDYTEIDTAIDQLEFDGVLYDKPMTRAELKEYIGKELAEPQVREWFSPHWTVMNERSILFYDEGNGHIAEQRPDRVIYDGKEMTVIDFKTGRQLEKHKSQVRGYMRLLKDMGYDNVRGYLWYIRHGEIVEVPQMQ